MTDSLDLDAAREARKDDEAEPLPIKLDGKTFHAIRPLRLSVAVAAAEGNVPAAIRGLFGEQAHAVLEAGLDLQDLRLIVDRLIAGSGKAGPGNASSASTG